VKAKVEMHCDKRAPGAGEGRGVKAIPAVAEDWGKEFLALIAAVRWWTPLDGALEHIATYGSGHSRRL